jgi:hypothetical protein
MLPGPAQVRVASSVSETGGLAERLVGTIDV